MIYGKSSIKSSAVEREDSVYVSGTGSVRSNDLGTARALSEGLTDAVDHYNQVAYNIQRRK